MNKMMLFTDGSVNPSGKIGYGAFLIVHEGELPSESTGANVKVRRFENTSSTKLELQTLIWALNRIQASDKKIVVYTDSQNIISLPGRRGRLEQTDFHSKKNKLLKNHELYREFYRITDKFDCELIKVQGHLSSTKKVEIDRFFTLVDRASRKALREDRQYLK